MAQTRSLVLFLVLVVVGGAASAKATFFRRSNDSYMVQLGRRFMHRQSHWSLSREFVTAHNTVRQQLNLPPMTWDRSLARYARRWASKRFLDCKMIHSYGPYGENLFWGGQEHWSATQAVDSWVMENAYYNPDTNECVPGQMCGHYTQVVWRDSVRVGCSRTRCLTGGILVYCEYDPPGNYVNENPFGKVFDQVVQTLSGTGRSDSKASTSTSTSSSSTSGSNSQSSSSSSSSSDAQESSASASTSASASSSQPKFSPDLLR